MTVKEVGSGVDQERSTARTTDEGDMQIIGNERELPAKESYVRSLCDPTVLIGGRSGECFVRRDGARWEWPGYKVTLDFHDRTVAEPATGIEDTVRFRPDGNAETVEHRLPNQKQAAA